MKLHDLSPDPGSRKKKIRRGRGRAARRGEKSGRGTKGQKKRSSVPGYYEGGQTPLYRRLPKRGFRPPNQQKNIQVVNISQLNRFDSGELVDPEKLLAAGLVKKPFPIKLLGDGQMEQALTIQVHAASKSAAEKISQAGGKLELLRSPKDGVN